jgi:hypothetical protein
MWKLLMNEIMVALIIHVVVEFDEVVEEEELLVVDDFLVLNQFEKLSMVLKHNHLHHHYQNMK